MINWFYDIFRLFMPSWWDRQTADPTHPHGRRFTRRYRRKIRLVKSLWIGAALLMLLCNSPALIVGLALATTFLSFCLLDETA